MELKHENQTLEILLEQVAQSKALYESAKDECERIRRAELGPEAVGRAVLLYECLQQTYQSALRLYNEHLLKKKFAARN